MSERDMATLRSLAERIDPEDAGAHNNLGVVFFQKGLIEDALAAFERALELDPRLEVARRNAEVAFGESGQLERRVGELEEAIRSHPGSIETRDTLARTYLLGGDPDAAADVWAELLRQHPESTPLHMKLAYAEAERGRVREAVRLLDAAARLSPELPAVRLQLAELLYDSGEADGAEREVRRALSLDDGLARAHAFLGRLLEETGRSNEAAESLERAVELDPGIMNPESHLSLDRFRSVRAYQKERGVGAEGAEDGALGGLARAMELRGRGELEGAAAELETTIASGHGSPEVRQALAEIRLLCGDLEEAASSYEALLAERDDSPKLWNERGVAVHRLGRFEEAVQAYRRVIDLDAAYALGWNNLAVALVQRGDTDAAERAFRKAVAGDPLTELLWNLGLFLSLNGRPEEAVDVYRAAVESDETVAESWNRLGSALLQARRPEPARDALLEALERDPSLAEARYQLGFALSALGDFRGALRETQRALEQVPILPTPRYQLLIDVQFEDGALPAPDAGEGEPVRAGSPVDDFDFEPSSLDAAFADFAPTQQAEQEASADEWLADARSALRRGQLGRASDAVGRAVAAAPDAVEPRLLEAELLLLQGLAGEALERYDAVLAAGIEDQDRIREARTGRARALLELDQPREAVFAAAAAVRAEGAIALLGRALLAAGRPEKAVEAFERAVAHGEADPVTLTAYGTALLDAGRAADARDLFHRSLATAPSAAARVGLARSLEALGDDSAALASYREAVAAVPSYAPAQLGRAELQWRTRNEQEAVRSLVDFLALDRTHIEGLVLLGSWLRELGRPDQAARSLERALRLDPEHQTALRELDAIHAGEGI